MKTYTLAVCTHNEDPKYLTALLTPFLDKNIPIVIIDDYSTNEDLLNLLFSLIDAHSQIKVVRHSLDGDFATHKNRLFEYCSTDYILNLDADEFITPDLLSGIEYLLEHNDIDVYAFPRINYVHNITNAYARSRGWDITTFRDLDLSYYMSSCSPAFIEVLQHYNLILEQTPTTIKYHLPAVAWPDYQIRLYRNVPEIRWKNAVHEVLDGYTTISLLPAQTEYAIHHYKTLERQQKQNDFYDTIAK